MKRQKLHSGPPVLMHSAPAHALEVEILANGSRGYPVCGEFGWERKDSLFCGANAAADLANCCDHPAVRLQEFIGQANHHWIGGAVSKAVRKHGI